MAIIWLGNDDASEHQNNICYCFGKCASWSSYDPTYWYGKGVCWRHPQISCSYLILASTRRKLSGRLQYASAVWTSLVTCLIVCLISTLVPSQNSQVRLLGRMLCWNQTGFLSYRNNMPAAAKLEKEMNLYPGRNLDPQNCSIWTMVLLWEYISGTNEAGNQEVNEWQVQHNQNIL